MSESTDDSIRSLDIACSVINALKDGQMGVTELSNQLGHSKSTIHDHLVTLNQNHLVVKENDQYRLSIKFFNISDCVRDQFENYEVICAGVNELAEETKETVQFAIEEHGRARYLYKISGEEGVQTLSSVGLGQPMHSTSMGKSMLAHLPREWVSEILNQHGLPSMTENTVTDQEELFDTLETVRDQGYALDDEENVAGLRCVGAPVLNNDDVLGAVSVSGPSSRIRGGLFREELPKRVKQTANVIELNSRYS
jgi:DNA-binding IclR family transcriptional regulator